MRRIERIERVVVLNGMAKQAVPAEKKARTSRMRIVSLWGGMKL